MSPRESAATPAAAGSDAAAVSGGIRPPSYLVDEERMPLPFCPGCGHARVTRALDEALRMLGRPQERVVVVTDIGCVGLTDRHFQT
ncbi:MAG TPA: hypothetical protein VFD74_06285, partial [Thermoleophilia bacterium]|nr:hypothetical protein [Thermoleophilia bacterium]